MENFGELITKRNRRAFLETMRVDFRHQTEQDYLHVWGLMWGFLSYLPCRPPVFDWDIANQRQLDATIYQDTYDDFNQYDIFREIARLLECDLTIVNFADNWADCLNTGDIYNLTILCYEGDWYFGNEADAIEALKNQFYPDLLSAKKEEIENEISLELETYSYVRNGNTYELDLSEKFDSYEYRSRVVNNVLESLEMEYEWVDNGQGFVNLYGDANMSDIAKVVGDVFFDLRFTDTLTLF